LGPVVLGRHRFAAVGQSSFGLDWQGRRTGLVGLVGPAKAAVGGLDGLDVGVLVAAEPLADPYVDCVDVFQSLVAFWHVPK
jgi:hypothetical protein